ncbi:hypothetical protein KEM56_004626 [Ascosphaera pollenicola]|nr:hypothetical protein KEM56_004626 [Ascosphaera pollenicola]
MAPGDARAGPGTGIGPPVVEISAAPNAQKPTTPDPQALFREGNLGPKDVRSGLGIQTGLAVVEIFTSKHPTPNTQRPGARFGGDPAPPNALGPNAPKSTAPDRRALFREVNVTIRDAVTADSSRAAHRVAEVSVFQHPTPKAPLGRRGFKRT